MKKTLKLCCILSILICALFSLPVMTHAKVTNPFENQTQERPILSGGKRTGTYLRILTAEFACTDSSLKKLYKYYVKNSKTYKYVVIDFGDGNGLYCKKKNKTFIYGTLKENKDTNGYSISNKKGIIKIKKKSVVRKTGNEYLDKD